jgi:hypothetical protein
VLGHVLDRCFQALHTPLQRRHSGFEGLEVVLDGHRGLVPQRLGEGALGVHEARGYATWVAPDKYFRLDHLNVYHKQRDVRSRVLFCDFAALHV